MYRFCPIVHVLFIKYLNKLRSLSGKLRQIGVYLESASSKGMHT